MVGLFNVCDGVAAPGAENTCTVGPVAKAASAIRVGGGTPGSTGSVTVTTLGERVVGVGTKASRRA
jgi:hypothetical protein